MEPRLRVGVIGCGVIAQVMHLPYLCELSARFEIAAICDISPSILQSVGDAFGIERRFTNWEDVIDEPLDVVMVLTPGTHAPAAIAAAEAGRHVFVEKPMCLSADEGEAMVAATRKAGVRLMVGYMKRYDPAYERLKEELPKIPDLRLARVTTLESPLRPYVAHYPLASAGDVDQDLLRRLQADDDRRVNVAVGSAPPELRQVYRSVLLDSLVHELNALRGLLGEPDSLEFAHLWNQGLILTLRWGSLRCSLSWVDLPGIARYQQEFAFYAPDHRITLQFPSPFLRSMPTQLVTEGGVTGTTHAWQSSEVVSYDEAFKRELIELYECVIDNREPRTGGLDGLHDVILCGAIVEAAHTGQPIAHPSALRLATA